MATKENPFVPGDGPIPPHLAGRANEQALLAGTLQRLIARAVIAGNIILTGPRGNGKTVLLRWFQRKIEAAGLDATWLTPDKLPDVAALAAEVAPPARWRDWLPRELSINVLGSGASARWELGGLPGNLSRLLTARCQQRPLVVLLDEAHTLDERLGRTLLNTSQEVRSAASFLLVLAGTPGLREHLNRMSANFWDRCEKLGIGLLDPAASAAALTVPLARDKITIEEPVLDVVVTDSQCYPYFLQLWGQALWDGAQVNGSHIDAALIASVWDKVAAARNAYYANRHQELQRRALAPLAAAVARAFARRARVPDQEMLTLLETTLTRASMSLLEAQCAAAQLPPSVWAADALKTLGYIWQYPGSDDWVPGISSLMNYVLARAPGQPLAQDS